MAYPNHDRNSVPIEFDISYIEEGIALVGQDDVRKLLILLIQNVGDNLILGEFGRAALAVISHSLILILKLILKLGE